jgi:hypothetical protein
VENTEQEIQGFVWAIRDLINEGDLAKGFPHGSVTAMAGRGSAQNYNQYRCLLLRPEMDANKLWDGRGVSCHFLITF